MFSFISIYYGYSQKEHIDTLLYQIKVMKRIWVLIASVPGLCMLFTFMQSTIDHSIPCINLSRAPYRYVNVLQPDPHSRFTVI